jgi:hypothetical protein
MSDADAACSLDPAGQEGRLAEFAELASAALLGSTRTPHGARIQLRNSPSVQDSLWRLIEAERSCCSFLEFGVEVGDEELSVEVSGPPSARPLIDRLFDLELATRPAR